MIAITAVFTENTGASLPWQAGGERLPAAVRLRRAAASAVARCGLRSRRDAVRSLAGCQPPQSFDGPASRKQGIWHNPAR